MENWVQINSMLDELPGSEPPPVPEPDRIRKLTITHPDELPTTELEVPDQRNIRASGHHESEKRAHEIGMQKSGCTAEPRPRSSIIHDRRIPKR
jgi:hypothetical protein